MNYREVLPHASLQDAIECYWSISSSVASSSFRTIYPDGCMDIIFNFGDALQTRKTDKINTNDASSFVVGNMLTPAGSRSTGKLELLGVRFKPGGLRHFLSEPLHLFTDTAVSICDLGSRRQRELAMRLREERSENRRIMLDQFFLEHHQDALSESWQGALSFILCHHGTKSISEVTRETGISEKQLERKFLQYVGLSPKQLSQVLRFRDLKNRLEQRGHENLLDLAWQTGFTDHAHLTKSFRRFAGITPSEFLRKG